MPVGFLENSEPDIVVRISKLHELMYLYQQPQTKLGNLQCSPVDMLSLNKRRCSNGMINKK